MKSGIWTKYFWKRAFENARKTVYATLGASGISSLFDASRMQLIVIGGIGLMAALISLGQDLLTVLGTTTSDPSPAVNHALNNGGIPIPEHTETVQLPDTVKEE